MHAQLHFFTGIHLWSRDRHQGSYAFIADSFHDIRGGHAELLALPACERPRTATVS
jgi:hypothetical protein